MTGNQPEVNGSNGKSGSRSFVGGGFRKSITRQQLLQRFRSGSFHDTETKMYHTKLEIEAQDPHPEKLEELAEDSLILKF